MKLPDGGSNASVTDDIARRRRMMALSTYSGGLGNSTGPATTTVLGG